MYTPALILIVKYGLSIEDNLRFSSGGSASESVEQNTTRIRFHQSGRGIESTSDTQPQSVEGNEAGGSSSGHVSKQTQRKSQDP